MLTLLCLAGLGLGALNVWSLRTLQAAHAAAVRASDASVECANLAEQIRSRRQSAPRVATRDIQSAELIRRIEQAAGAAGVEARALLSITPQSPHRLGDSDYNERSADVLLAGADVRQLLTFCHGLRSGDAPLYCRSLRLSAPREEPSGRTWTCEVSVAYRTYAPRKAPRE